MTEAKYLMRTGDKIIFTLKFFYWNFFSMNIKTNQVCFSMGLHFLPSKLPRQHNLDGFSPSDTRQGQHVVWIVDQEVAAGWPRHCWHKEPLIWTHLSPVKDPSTLRWRLFPNLD